MRVEVLGSAAGGGFPQWNCGCPNCAAVRAGDPSLRARTQDSLAVTSDGEGWCLLNASPEIRAQIERTAALHPRGNRHTPIRCLVLTNGDLDHCLGLFSLRESQPLAVYATDPVRRGIVDGNTMARTLARFDGHVQWRPLPLGREISLDGVDGAPTGLTVLALPAAGKPPLHLMGQAAAQPEDNVALFVRERESGRSLCYAPSVAALGPFCERLPEVDWLFFDGTFWSDDELVRLGLGDRRAADMAHLPIGGDRGTLAALARRARSRNLFTHVNNTNPILREDSPERRAVTAAGWEVATDGLEISS
jgi:pyrroloquinoline quinone biosynthesis protein B